MWAKLPLLCVGAMLWVAGQVEGATFKVLPPRDLSRPDRIVGGEPVKRGDLPWQVSIQQKSGHSLSHFCGGTLIAPGWVVTAAHCTKGINYDHVVVSKGAWDLNEENSQYKVSKVLVAPYDPLSLKHDIALLKLNLGNPVKMIKEGSQSVAVETRTEEAIGQRCTISGWGRVQENGNIPNILRAADVEVKSDDECASMFGGRSSYTIYNTNLCAGGQERDACQGDSGGPLVCCSDSTREPSSCRLAGITSWGIGCATRGIPGVYTEVAHYADWIKEMILKESGNKGLKTVVFYQSEMEVATAEESVGDEN